MNQQTRLHPEQLKDKNLAFFKQMYPALYKQAKGHSFERLTLNITADGIIDVWDGNKSIYGGDAERYAHNEISLFRKEYSEGESIVTVPPPQKGELGFHRFFSKRIHTLANEAPSSTDYSALYRLPDFYPMIVFFGCGLGIHVEKMIKQTKIINCIIFEPDPEYFYASLYVTDWRKLFEHQHFLGHKIDFIIAHNKTENTDDCTSIIWNTLVNYCPCFPTATLTYCHISEDPYQEIIKNITKDMHFFLNQWGYYDDEINQINNALHNISKSIPEIKNHDSKIKINTPAIIVGGGPSLDKRIDEIKKNRENIFLISCGTSVHPLIKEGIVPDIHVEIESHMLTYDSLSGIKNPEFFKKTTLIGALQLPPNVFDLFDKKLYFLKDSTGLSELFSKDKNIIKFATPTCTNTGVALACHLGFQEIFLYGMDFGFPSKKEHHSKNSIYYAENTSKSIKSSVSRNFKNSIEVDAFDGGKIETIPMYCTSRKTVEICSSHWSRISTTKISSCSMGAKIKGVEYIPPEDIEFKETTQKEHDFAGNIYKTEEIKERIDFLLKSLKSICREIEIFLRIPTKENLYGIFFLCNKINNHLQNNTYKKHGFLYYTIRGSIWHYLHIGVSISMSIENPKERESFISKWKDSLSSFLIDVPDHCQKITSKSYPNAEDPWIKEDIVGNERLYQE